MNITRVSNKQKGFTIIELMIVLLIMAILIALASPSFTKMIRDNRVQTTANGLIVALSTARNEAIRRGVNVTICASNAVATPACGGTDWAAGWLVYSGVLSSTTVIKAGDLVSNVATGGTAPSVITFTPRGMVDPAIVLGTGTLVVNASPCTSGTDTQFTVTLNTVGRTVTTTGTCP